MRHDERKPVSGRPGIGRLGSENLHRVARREVGVQRRKPAVDLRSDAAMPHFGVDGIGEINGRGAGGKRHDLPHRRERIHLFQSQSLGEVRHRGFSRLVGVLRPIHQAAEPEQFAVVFLVAPMGSHAVFGALVHLLCADLHLQELPRRPHDRGVKRLVEVELGHGDVIFETPLSRLPDGMDGAQSRIAVLNALCDHTDAYEVIDLVELQLLLLHLVEDAPEMLRAARDFGVDEHLVQSALYLRDDLSEINLPLRRAFFHQMVYLGIPLRMKHGERQILKLGLELLHAQTISQRSIHLQSFSRYGFLALKRKRSECLHVVETVGEFDEQHPQVASHCNEHLAQGGYLLRRAVGQLQAVQLREAVHQKSYIAAEIRL